MWIIRAALLGVFGAGTVTCGGSSPQPATPSSPSISSVALNGVYSGRSSDTSGPGNMSWTVSQAGASVSGAVAAVTPKEAVAFTGALSGTLSGTTLSFTIAVSNSGISKFPNCSATLNGTATGVTNLAIAGSYIGTNSCTGSFTGGQFALTKAQ
jgi:hypothetical protein